jgi:hypothetical protein
MTEAQLKELIEELAGCPEQEAQGCQSCNRIIAKMVALGGTE